MEMWFSEFHTPDVKHSIRVNRQLFSRQSDYQRIDIFETPEFGRVLTLDGNVMLTERDEFIYDEMITHVPMAIHKEAKEIIKTFIDMIKRETKSEEELEKLEEAIAFRNVANMPARVKCALLAWHTIEDILNKK